jgi:hypothetical protein
MQLYLFTLQIFLIPSTICSQIINPLYPFCKLGNPSSNPPIPIILDFENIPNAAPDGTSNVEEFYADCGIYFTSGTFVLESSILPGHGSGSFCPGTTNGVTSGVAAATYLNDASPFIMQVYGRYLQYVCTLL